MSSIQNCIELRSFNTFSVKVYAKKIIKIYDEHELWAIYQKSYDNNESVLILGEGSNVLFLDNYKGVVLLNRIKGIFITESKTQWKLHIGAGEKWDEIVQYTVNKNMPGLENLAHIPGYVGSAIIQNIGAYGLELSQLFEYVDVLDLNKGIKIRLYYDECNFQYRNSIFRSHLSKYVIIFVGLKLNKIWKPILYYPGLNNYYKVCTMTPRQILNTIVLIRNRKLPNPKIHGNAGSFFKNPIISINMAHSLIHKYPTMPYYYQSDGKIKLFAGWLIENCQLKGYVLGEASVYSKQSLILINHRQKATGTEIAALALYIYKRVADKFNIYLQPEVRLIGSNGEINPKILFKNEVY